jgi:hypothetical protein
MTNWIQLTTIFLSLTNQAIVGIDTNTWMAAQVTQVVTEERSTWLASSIKSVVLTTNLVRLAIPRTAPPTNSEPTNYTKLKGLTK